ncbi:MAG: T9SS type A sorting domain-containing protein [Cytophagaceae bacterium]|nr:T9SS type A sorting domain-containing protein [Cytophagaceae bacterium]
MKKLLLSYLLFTMTFCLNAQIPNPGFETWAVGMGGDNPADWVSSNAAYAIFDAFTGTSHPPSVIKETPAYAGSYAVKVKNTVGTFMGVTADTLPGFVLAMSGTDSEGFPYTSRPAALTGYYKFVQGGTGAFPNIDTAVILIGLSKWNTTNDSRDSIAGAYFTIYQNASSYTALNIPLFYLNGLTPDSARIFIFSSFTSGKSFPNTALAIDALAFTGTTGINHPISFSGIQTYPNPAKDYIDINNIPLEISIIEIRDFTGRKIKTTAVNSALMKISTLEFTSGIYHYSLLDREGNILFTEKFVVNQ